MLNIVIPMAGAGSRFSNVGFKEPKPLIKINKKSMIEAVINNLRPCFNHKFIFICQKDHIEKYNLYEKLLTLSPNCEVIAVQGLTDGAARTVLCASKFIDNLNPLVIANSDQYVDRSLETFFESVLDGNSDGQILTMTANDPKWSYVQMDSDNRVSLVIEKKVISNEATVGIYGFSRGKYFVNAANRMIDKNIRTNGEFYVAPAYNELIKDNMCVNAINIGSVEGGMFGLGTPEDLKKFQASELSINF